MTYIAVEYENKKLNWLSKHLIEIMCSLIVVFFGITFSFMKWEANLLLEVKDQVTINTNDIHHINKAVNNVDPTQDTLRELVESINVDVEILKERTKSRYDPN